MESYRSWLPGAAIERGACEAPLRQVVADWSSKWFARQQAMLAGDPVATTALNTPGGSGWETADGLMIVPAMDAEAAMITLSFGLSGDADALTAADEAALRAVVQSCLADLRSRLAAAFGLPPDAPWRPAMTKADAPRWEWQVEGYGGVALLRIAADEALIARRVRGGLPPAARDRALAPLDAALAGQSIGVSALVGRCRLTTAELGGLGQGDVVVLDRMLGDPVDLAIDRDPKPLPCTVEERDGCLILTL